MVRQGGIIPGVETRRVSYGGTHLATFEVSGDGSQGDVDRAASEMREAMRAFPRQWEPQSRLLFLARLFSATIRGVTGPEGSQEHAPRDAKLEDQILTAFVRKVGVSGVHHLFRELSREERAQDAIAMRAEKS